MDRYGCAVGVERDLSHKVQEKVRTELVRSEVRTANPATEKEIVEQFAATLIEVVKGHRKLIVQADEVVSDLLATDGCCIRQPG